MGRLAKAMTAITLLLGAVLAFGGGPDTPRVDRPAVPAVRVIEVATLQNGFSIRHDHREILANNTRLYLSPGNDSFVDVPTAQIAGFEQEVLPEPAPQPVAASLPPLQQVVDAASDRHQIDADLINSMIHAESSFNPRARSPKGAQGLMQLMPQTASRLGVSDPYNPEANVDGGTRYLRDLLENYDHDLVKALAAYNAGPGPVARYGGVPPYHETRAYVARVIREFNRKKLAARRSAQSAVAKPPAGSRIGASAVSFVPKATPQ